MASPQFARKPRGTSKVRAALSKEGAARLTYSNESHTEAMKSRLYAAKCVWQTREDTRGGTGKANEELGFSNTCKASENKALLNPRRIFTI